MLKNDLQRVVAGFFTSRVRVKILALFFMNPRDKYHMRKISRLVNEQINAVRRELMSMEKSDFLISNKEGIKKFYTVNPDFPFFNEFRSIFVKSFGLGYHIFLNKKDLGEVKFAILTHTYLNREESDSGNPDLIIVGEPNRIILDRLVRESERIEKKSLHYIIMGIKELEMFKKRRDPLIYSVSVLPRSMVIGNDEEFVV